MDSVSKQVTVRCTECDEFEFTKSYTGMSGTPGEDAYEESGGFDECPVCGGDVEREPVES